MPKKHQKTCWSVVINLFSTITSREFILGYLYFSGQFLSKPVAAQKVREDIYFTYGMKKSHSEPSDICIHAAPGCLLNAKSNYNNEGKRKSIDVGHLCSSDPDFNHHLNEWPLDKQIVHNRFYGTKLCNGTLENKAPSSYPINARPLSETDYEVNFDIEDRLNIKYGPRS